MVQCAPCITKNFWGPKFRFLTVLLHFQQFRLAWNSNEDTWTQGADGWLALWLLKLRQRRDHSWCHCPDAHWCANAKEGAPDLLFGCSVWQNYRTISSRCLIDRLADDCGGPLMQDLNSSQNLAQPKQIDAVNIHCLCSRANVHWHTISIISPRYNVADVATLSLQELQTGLETWARIWTPRRPWEFALFAAKEWQSKIYQMT